MQSLPTYDEALAITLTDVERLATETVSLRDAFGRRLAAAVRADRDLPPFNRATMDGYAVRAADIGRVTSLKVVGNVAAGSDVAVSLSEGEVVTIATGAPVPPSADAVIQHELSDRKNPVQFTLDHIKSGQNIHRKGEDTIAGKVVVDAGVRLGAQHVGILASVGCAQVEVASRPRVVILTSGDEVKDVSEPVAAHQIRNSNAPMLRDTATAMGCEVVRLIHVADDPAATCDAVGEALEHADILLTTGGISAGARDFLPDAFAAHGVSVRVKGAAIQPGKPIFVGDVAQSDRRIVRVVGLPGNPVSVLATAHLFVGPLVQRLQGVNEDDRWRTANLAEDARPNPKRQAFRPACWDRDGQVRVLSWAGSGDLIHTAMSDGLVALPCQPDPVRAGATMRFLPWAWTALR